MNRRSFIKRGVGVTLFSGLFSSVFISCYKKTNSPPKNENGLSIDGLEHHTGTTLTAQNIEDGKAGTYSTTTNDGHKHTFDITAQHITDIKAGSTITVTSTTINDHAHKLTIKLIPVE